MKIYVAGKLSDINRVQSLQDVLRHLGHEITHDWTPYIEEWAALRASGEADKFFVSFKMKVGEANMRGVEAADLLVWLYSGGSEGAFAELGAALTRNIPIFVLKEDPVYYSDSAYLYIRGVSVFKTMQELMNHIKPTF